MMDSEARYVVALAKLDEAFSAVNQAKVRIDEAKASIDRDAAEIRATAVEFRANLLRCEAAAETRIAISRASCWLGTLGYDGDETTIYIHSDDITTLATAIGEINERLAIASAAVARVAAAHRGVHEADLDAVRRWRDAMVRQRSLLVGPSLQAVRS